MRQVKAAIAKLIEQTQGGELEWAVVDVSDRVFPDLAEARDVEAYKASLDGRTLRLVSCRLKAYTDVDEFYWYEDLGLEVGDQRTNVWWRFPNSPLVGDLLRAITYQIVGAESFIDKLTR